MTNNKVLENLENRTVQQAPIKLIYAHNDFNVFDQGTTEFYGDSDEYISDQPIEDKIEWKQELTERDYKKIPPVFRHRLGILMDEVFYTIFSKKKMRQALQGPQQEATLLDSSLFFGTFGEGSLKVSFSESQSQKLEYRIINEINQLFAYTKNKLFTPDSTKFLYKKEESSETASQSSRKSIEFLKERKKPKEKKPESAQPSPSPSAAPSVAGDKKKKGFVRR